MPETMTDPRTYFKFQSCERCFYKPCDRLRFGGVFPGKFIFVHNNYIGIGFIDCPFVAQSFEEIERLIGDVSLSELLFHINDILGALTPSERLRYRQRDYVSEYSDVAGRIRFLKALWEDRVMSVVRIPDSFSTDRKMRKWLFANEGLSYMLKKPELEDNDDAAVTDGMAAQQQAEEQQSLSDPRWEQDDDQREQDSPDAAIVGDVVNLMASASGFDDGAQVTFDIYDTSSGSSQKIDTVSGSVDGGRAQAQWTVADPNDSGDNLALEFEASANGKTSGRAEVLTKPANKLWIRISISPKDAGNDKFILTSSTGDSWVKNATDDQMANDQSIDLLFDKLDTSLNYTLKVIAEDGTSVTLFKDVAYSDLSSQAGGKDPLDEAMDLGEYIGDIEQVDPTRGSEL